MLLSTVRLVYVYAEYDQKNDGENLLVVFCDDSWQENVKIRRLVVRMTPGYAGQRALPRIHQDDDDLRSNQDERHIEKSIEVHPNDAISDVEDGKRHREPNQCVERPYEIEHQVFRRSDNLGYLIRPLRHSSIRKLVVVRIHVSFFEPRVLSCES